MALSCRSSKASEKQTKISADLNKKNFVQAVFRIQRLDYEFMGNQSRSAGRYYGGS